jgi:hypothetical protein
MTATQLDLFGQFEAADQAAAARRFARDGLLYERILTGADLGYQLSREDAGGWPNGIPAGALEAVAAAYAEMHRGYLRQAVPGAPGACSRCDHRMVNHNHCRYACECAGCDCPALLDPVTEEIDVSVLPGGILRVRSHAEVMTELWAGYGLTWPGDKQ